MRLIYPLCIYLLTLLCSSCQNGRVEELELEEAQERIAELEDELSETQYELEEAQSRLDSARSAIDEAVSRIGFIRDGINNARLFRDRFALDDAEDNLDDLETMLDDIDLDY